MNDSETATKSGRSPGPARNSRRGPLTSPKDLEVYAIAYALAMQVFTLTRRFPPEERYALTSQIRRSSRSVCLNLREAWAKRRYEAHFLSKLTDCDGENSETDSSLDFARDCGYITALQHQELTEMAGSVGRMLGAMLKNPGPFLLRESRGTSDIGDRESEIGGRSRT